MLLFSLLSQQLHAQGGTNPTVPNCIILADPVDICVGQSVSFFKFNASGSEDCDTIPTATSDVISAEFHPGAGIPPITIPGNPTTGFYFQNVSITYNVPGVYYPYIIFYNAPPYQPTTIYPVEMQNNGPGSNYIPAVITVSDVPVISSPSSGLSFCDNGLNEVVLMNNPIPALYPNAIELSFQHALPTDNVTVDWGDGNQGNFTVASFNAGIAQVTHYYPGTGLYIIQITVDGQCGTSTFQIPVTIEELSADFGYYAGCVDQAVLFNFHSSCLAGQSYTLDWYFGDGATLLGTTNSNPTHTYSAAGSYTVTLVVHANGTTVTHSETIVVSETTKPEMSFLISNLCDGNNMIANCINYSDFPFNTTIQAVNISGNLVSFTFGGAVSQLSVSGPGMVRFVLTTPDGCSAFSDIEVFDCCTKDDYLIMIIDTIRGGDEPIYDTTYVVGPAHYTFNNAQISNEISGGNAPIGGIADAIIEINGMLKLDESYSFTNCQIYMGPEAQIRVKEGYSVIFTDCIVQACSNVIWNRVYAEGVSSSITSIRSKFYHARQAISVDRGSILNVDHSAFNENHTGIYVSNYWHGATPVTYPAYITNSSFNDEHPGPGNFLPLLYPLNAMEAQYGIHAWMVGRLVVDGHQSGASGNVGNDFYQSLYGIYAQNSGLKVLNSTFTNHWSPSTAKPNKAAIRAANVIFGRPLPPPRIELIPASGTTAPAIFTNNTFGILADNVELWVSYNQMIDQQNAIKIVEPKRTSYIRHNQITNGKMAILVQNVFEHYSDMSIESNMVKNYEHGIRTTNLLSTAGVGLSIKNNHVQFTQTNTQLIRTGIRVEACAKATISGNTVLKNSPLVAGEYPLLKGIYLSESEGAQVFDNQISSVGHGIYCIGYLAQAELYCNTMNACYQGVHLQMPTGTAATVMTHQRQADQAQDNIITNGIYQFQVAGQNSLGAQYWRRRSNASGGYVYQFQFGTFNPVSTSNLSCTGADLPPDVPTYTEMVVQDSTEFSELEAEMDYKAKTHVYRDLREGSYDSLMAAGDSTIFYSFMQQVAATDQGLWEEYLHRLEAGELDTARLYMELMDATGSLDQNNAYCAEAYLAHYAWQNPFAAATEQGLTLLAHQTPYIAGRAVYSARVMLDIDNLDYGILYKQDPSFDAKLESFELWPNPSSNQVQLVFGKECNGWMELRVRDLSGRLVLEHHGTIRSEYFSLELTGIAPGLYLVEARLEGAILGTQKLIKQ